MLLFPGVTCERVTAENNILCKLCFRNNTVTLFQVNYIFKEIQEVYSEKSDSF